MNNVIDGSLSIITVLCVVLVIHYHSLSQSHAARVLDETYLPDDGHGKVGVDGSQPRQAGTWTGNDTPSGTVLLTPPTAATTVAYASNRGNQPRESCKESNKSTASGTNVAAKSCAFVSGNNGTRYAYASGTATASSRAPGSKVTAESSANVSANNGTAYAYASGTATPRGHP